MPGCLLVDRLCGGIEVFFDWNNNGRKDDSFDNMLDFMMLSEMEKEDKKSQQEKASRGGCLMMLIGMPLWLPVALVMAIVNIK